MDTKGGLKFDIEEERDKIKKMEERYRADLDKLRSEQSQAIGELEANHIFAKKQHDQDKQKLEDEKTRALEQEKKKLM